MVLISYVRKLQPRIEQDLDGLFSAKQVHRFRVARERERLGNQRLQVEPAFDDEAQGRLRRGAIVIPITAQDQSRTEKMLRRKTHLIAQDAEKRDAPAGAIHEELNRRRHAR